MEKCATHHSTYSIVYGIIPFLLHTNFTFSINILLSNNALILLGSVGLFTYKLYQFFFKFCKIRSKIQIFYFGDSSFVCFYICANFSYDFLVFQCTFEIICPAIIYAFFEVIGRISIISFLQSFKFFSKLTYTAPRYQYTLYCGFELLPAKLLSQRIRFNKIK